MFYKKKIKELQDIIKRQTEMLSTFQLINRDMNLSPHEFIISNGQNIFKDLKIIYKKKNITDKVSKVIIFGPSYFN